MLPHLPDVLPGDQGALEKRAHAHAPFVDDDDAQRGAQHEQKQGRSREKCPAHPWQFDCESL